MSLFSRNRRSNRVMPGFETLEGRQLMSVTPALAIHNHLQPAVSATMGNINHTLLVRGSAFADQIHINDDGNHVHVFAIFGSGFVSLGNFTGVEKVLIDTGGGNDTVTYNVKGTSPLDMNGPNNFANRHTVVAFLGAGNDTLTANVVDNLLLPGVATTIGSLGTGSNLAFSVNGSTGNDSASFRADIIGANSGVAFLADGSFGNDSYSAIYGDGTIAQQGNTNVRLKFTGGAGNDIGNVSVLGDLSTGTHVSADLEGGIGADVLSANYSGKLNGETNFFLTGDAGNDSLFTSALLGKFSSFGKFQAQVFGGLDSDILTAIVRKDDPASLTTTSAFLDGGFGFDTAQFNDVATLKSIEKIVNLP